MPGGKACRYLNTFSALRQEPRVNEVGIQYISAQLHNLVFPGNPIDPKTLKARLGAKSSKSRGSSTTLPAHLQEKIALARKYLANNDLLGKKTLITDPIAFDIPPLQGRDLDEHFHRLGLFCADPYLEYATTFSQKSTPSLPQEDAWIFQSGWTRYAKGKKPCKVEYPLEEKLVFDVECLYKLSPYPVMATAVSETAWYAWVSPFLTKESTLMEHLIPMGCHGAPKLIVGHNVGYDRSRILEEYHMTQSKAFYLDTMSLHVAINGLSSRQRGSWMKHKKKLRTADEYIREEANSGFDINETDVSDLMNDISVDREDDPWLEVTSMNSLAYVAELHCGVTMDKADRDYFSLEDAEPIRENFARLMLYCATDVDTTFQVFAKTFPKFREHVPHPVSFAALRQIGTSFLPTTRKWDAFVANSEAVYQQSIVKVEQRLRDLAEEAVLMREDASEPWKDDFWLSQLDWKITPMQYTKKGLPRKNQRMPGYPEWYKSLCPTGSDKAVVKSKGRIACLLFKLQWEGCPIVWFDSQGWCFQVPLSRVQEMIKKNYNVCEFRTGREEVRRRAEDRRLQRLIQKELNPEMEMKPEIEVEPEVKAPKPKKREKTGPKKVSDFEATETDLALLEKLRGNFEYELFRVPHPDGPNQRCAILMSKAYHKFAEKGILTSQFEHAQQAFVLNSMSSYWVSSRLRIAQQFVVYNDDQKNKRDFGTESKMGIILPKIQSMGTVTRRSVENTWLTASNAKKTRIGSELKSLIEAPPGYCFVGADVDSEELWIASLVGDSIFKLHGGTALGWMTLEGTKSEGTDLHSKTANILGISRNEAKVFNYGRIYGAGLKFACTLLKQFNPTLTEEQAAETAQKLYDATKGKRLPSGPKFAGKMTWFGGSESVVFNRLEMIAEQEVPRTPILGAGITQALTKKYLKVNSYLPSRINWAIQSSGVDYLHLLLVGMEYLIRLYKVDARLLITVHDEVRYMVKEEDKYKTTLLMQICNLWTRAMFAQQLGISEIPQSCAFFSAVDVDHVLRKEVDMDCVTPSNLVPIRPGESLTIEETLTKCATSHGSLLGEADSLDLSHYEYSPRVPVFADIDSQYSPSMLNRFIELQVAKDEDEFKAVRRKSRQMQQYAPQDDESGYLKKEPVVKTKAVPTAVKARTSLKTKGAIVITPPDTMYEEYLAKRTELSYTPEFEEGPLDALEFEMMQKYEDQMFKRKKTPERKYQRY
ncbi:hypothetical protein BABINDRAFT_159071 [Babjeviella inositovora NRRL Y-12698]|uniref:DNA polymerase gamma n=1 Tax=Babjeviella inositovora NRRL Y-12698 TaxID=984486 RepID=A0A1E3QXU6_9ASCO|nr:uncharacterized protein BABINDRAFT_159071 [Babjeviella inositovora NRRL Y-12698]ODQ82495.1 hypothetical protein BABINDRAFT_159071 [Babjeviella inositovora NRRL Y-12698]